MTDSKGSIAAHVENIVRIELKLFSRVYISRIIRDLGMSHVCFVQKLAIACCLSVVTLPINALGQEQAIIDSNQYDSLQAALDAVPREGGIVRIAPGRYELTEPLRVKTGDTTLEGMGAATFLVNLNEGGLPCILIENPEYVGKAVPSAERLWRVRVANLRITGNPKSGSGILARYIEEIFIQGVTSSYNGGDGIELYTCYEDPRISDNLLTYNRRCGVSLVACHDIVVSANHFEENQTGLKCTDSFNLAMSGNNLDDHLGDGIVVENTYGSVIASNMIEECQGWAIVLDRDVYGTTVSANVIAHEFTGGIDLRDAHGCSVSANTFTIVKQIGVAVRPNSGAITICGNNFSDSWISSTSAGELPKRNRENSPQEVEPNAAAGVLLSGCTAVVLSGNLFSRLSTPAIVQQGECSEIVNEGSLVHGGP